MFLDQVKIKIASGRGGHGACTFRQEKFVAHGGPDGGDGGKGGSVYLLASEDLNTLLDFKYKSFFKANDGEKGAKKNRTGASGEDIVIKVPVGTIVRDVENELVIADLKDNEQKVLVADGGRGGRGNARFKSNKTRVPGFSEPGEPAIERELELELKLIADIGIIGYPNAGKSTFISKISAAKPKIADYAFTTIVPNLGVVRKEYGDSYTVADIPGLIEGASSGYGLGFQFLRHVERTRLLVHMVDVWGMMGTNIKDHEIKNSEDPLNNFIQVNYELFNYSEKLARKKQIIVLNKIEAYPEEELANLVKKFEDYTGLALNDFSWLDSFNNDQDMIGLFTISAVSGDGLAKLKNFIEKSLDLVPREDHEVELDEDTIASDHDDSAFSINKEIQEDGLIAWQISCGKLERVMKLVDIRDLEALNYLFKVTKGLGVIEALKASGAVEGDLINIDGVDFEITDAVLL